jgi:SAM-dependent methyltransferase
MTGGTTGPGTTGSGATGPGTTGPGATGAGTTDPLAELATAEFWDARYGGADRLFSGTPNVQLVERVAGLAPGTALDVGCGEGADAIWLATRGWTVTGADVSAVALSRAAAAATAAGVAVAWERTGPGWAPPPAAYDLVTTHYLHLPAGLREPLHRHLAAAVRPGGTVLVVGHHHSHVDHDPERQHLRAAMFTTDEVTAALAPADWDIVFAGEQDRPHPGPDGPVTTRDVIVQAIRR